MITRIIKCLRTPFAWRVIRDSGVWLYSENTITGARKAVWKGSGYQPLAHHLLRPGDRVYGPNGVEIIDSEYGTGQRVAGKYP